MLIYGLAAVLVIAAAPALWLSQPSLHRPATWGAISFVAAMVQPAIFLLLTPRTQTDVGAVAMLGPTLTHLSQAFTALVVVSGAVAILTPSRPVDAVAKTIIGAVWTTGALLVIAGAFHGEAVLARYYVVFAIALHAAIVSLEPAQVLRWARVVLRTVVGISLVSVLVNPSWAFIGASDIGYDRTIGGFARLSGLAPHPGMLALLAALLLVLEFASPRSGWRNLWAVASVLALVLAQARTLWLAAALALLILALNRSTAFRALAWAGIASIVGVTLLRPDLVYTPDWTFGSNNVATLSGRTIIWEYALRAFEANPIIGYGPGFLSPGYRSLELPAQLQFVGHAHNQVVQALAESGLLGLLLLLVTVAAACWGAWTIRRSDGGLAMAWMSVVVAMSVTGVPFRPVGEAIIPPLIILAYVAVSTSVHLGGPHPTRRATDRHDRHDRKRHSLTPVHR